MCTCIQAQRSLDRAMHVVINEKVSCAHSFTQRSFAKLYQLDALQVKKKWSKAKVLLSTQIDIQIPSP